ncbi:MAG: VOC family protein [Pseudomonadota bacterium]
MATELALVTYLARDYDEAIAWFQGALGFVLVEDADLGAGKRWVRMAAHAEAETGFLIAKAVGAQVTALGRSAGGRVAYFLHTHAFGARADQITAHGGVFEGPPRHEPYGKVAVFRDLYGNRWGLIEPADMTAQDVAARNRKAAT